ncbi:MAG: hypothetical protein U0787_15540 [Polyangia bacterium]
MEPGHRLLVADFVGGPDAVTTLIPGSWTSLPKTAQRSGTDGKRNGAVSGRPVPFPSFIPLPAVRGHFRRNRRRISRADFPLAR